MRGPGWGTARSGYISLRPSIRVDAVNARPDVDHVELIAMDEAGSGRRRCARIAAFGGELL